MVVVGLHNRRTVTLLQFWRFAAQFPYFFIHVLHSCGKEHLPYLPKRFPDPDWSFRQVSESSVDLGG